MKVSVLQFLLHVQHAPRCEGVMDALPPTNGSVSVAPCDQYLVFSETLEQTSRTSLLPSDADTPATIATQLTAG
jgi:hypothetical protein